jgi:hypothetical protein
MASDPQFGAYSNSTDPHSFQVDEPERKRGFWQNCLIGCLVVFAVMVVLGVIAGFWISQHWRGWFANIGSQVLNQMIDSSDLPQQEKVEVKVQVERVAKAFGEGKISNDQFSAIVKKLVESPLMPTFVVMALERHYFARSKLSDEEKAEGRISLKRFARGVFDGKIKDQGIDAVMAHVADRRAGDRWELKQSVTDEELRAALSEAKAQADAANIPAEPENVDPSDEVKRIIDESLQLDVEKMPN